MWRRGKDKYYIVDEYGSTIAKYRKGQDWIYLLWMNNKDPLGPFNSSATAKARYKKERVYV